MFGAIRNLFGLISVKENKETGTIIVNGIPADFVKEAIEDLVKIKKINRNLFLESNKYVLEFYSFFAIEVVYLFNQVLANSPSYRARRIIENILEELNKNTWISNVNRNDIKSIIDLSLLDKLKWKALDHQLEFLTKFGDVVPRYELRGLLLASSPGTGKTFMDLALGATIIPREVAEIKIIISPKNALELVWEDTINKLFYDKPTSWVSTSPGDAPDGCEYYIFHYEALDRAKELCQRLVSQGKKYFTVIDESHNFNEIGSKRTQLIIEICSIGKGYSVWASGSPMKKSKLEMIPLLRSIDPKFNDAVESAFKKIYSGDEEAASAIMYHRLGFYSYKIDKTVVMKEKAIPVKIKVRLKNPDVYLLKNIQLEMRAFIVDRVKEIQKDLSKYNDTFEACLKEHQNTLKTKEARDAFNIYKQNLEKTKKNSMSTMLGAEGFELLRRCKTYETNILIPSLSKDSQKNFKASRSIVKTLMLKVRGEALGQIVSKRRAECAAELAINCNLEDIISKGIAKSMVFSSYTSPLDVTDKYLTEKGFTTTSVYGNTAKQVTSTIRDFTDKEEINPILATFASLSTAVPVLAANQVILLDVPFRNYILDQTVSRALRLGQTNPVYLISIVLDTDQELNISTRASSILAACQQEIANVLGKEFSGIADSEYDVQIVDEQDIVEDVDIEDSIKRVESNM